MGRKFYTLQLEGNTGEAWAATALVQMLTEQAKLCGFVDVESVDITVRVKVVGAAFEPSVAGLRARLSLLDVATMDEVEVKELRDS